MQPYYADDAITLYHADFHDVFGPEHPYDAVVTDPPYGSTSLAWDRWPYGWLLQAPAFAPVLWCFGSMRMFFDHHLEFSITGWKYAQEIVWEKHNGSSLAADRFSRVHEFAVQWYQGKWGDLFNSPPHTPDAVQKVVRRKALPSVHQGARGASTYRSVDGGDRLMRSVIRLRSMHGAALNETEKPVQLVSLLIACSVPPGGTVFDPFAGAGTTGVAARQLGRKAVLVELREEQCEVAARRFERETAVPLMGGV